MQEVQPQNGFILFNTAQKLQYGAFKSMREGQINLVGPCPFQSISGTTSVALKQPYKINSSHSDLSSSVVPTLSVSLDEQIKDLAADALSIQWATALLQDVYDFIALFHRSRGITCPVAIPQFRFVKSGPAITNVPGVAPDDKEAYLIEELIRSEEEPWRKYINNNHSHPRFFHDHENQHRGQFLAFCQHVQYWRTGCQAFTMDFQGKHVFDKSIVLVRQLHQAVIHSLQTHKLSHIRARSFLLHYLTPSYSVLSDLGRKLFSKGNVQDTHRDFETEHECNVFCDFFEVPILYGQSSTSLHGKQKASLPFRLFLVFTDIGTTANSTHFGTACPSQS